MIRSRLDRFFRRTAPAGPGDRLLVAFSGGPDSTALLWALAGLAAERRFRLHAAHLDHALDEGSGERARRASELADSIGVPLVVERLTRRPSRSDGGLEDWARRARYRFLEQQRLELDARYLVTAHHRDDQIETVLLRWAMGSGLEGLAAIQPRRGPLVRPLLDVGPEALRRSLEEAGLEPVFDPTNLDPARFRNRIRHQLLPRLRQADPDLDQRLLRLAASSSRIASSLEERLRSALGPRSEPTGASIDLEALRRLPSGLLPFALSALHRAAGRPYPAGRAARTELARQLASGDRVGCDCGSGWQWSARCGRLHLLRPETGAEPFAYTLSVPGEVVIPPLGLRLSVAPETAQRWMFEGRRDRAALRLPLEYRDSLVVRNRRPGDRVRPLGCRYTRRLKDVLIDRGVPRQRRDRLPLLCRGERVLWVPGITIDDDLKLDGRSEPWVARLEPLSGTPGNCHRAEPVDPVDGPLSRP